jgi:SAM-dependent methyltransferase
MALLWFLEGACLRRATRIHVLSKFSADLLWKLYRIPADRIVSIPGGVDPERFRPAADRDAVRNALGFTAKRPLLFTLRNLEARMGLDILIRAMAILRRQLPEVLLLIGGAGSRRHNLESLTASLDLNGHVRFLGYVPEAHLPLYYQAADLFVLPTRELEGFGLVTVEALACGTPVVGTPVGATPEILHPLDSALVFRDMSPEGMAEELRRVLDRLRRDPVDAQSLRQACRRHVKAHYSWADSVSRLEDAFRQLMARPVDRPESVRACPVCGAFIQRADLYYLGSRYLRCDRCGTGVAAAFPSAANLLRYYESDYPIRYGHERVTGRQAEIFASILDRLAELQKPGRLLDVGCGGGHVLKAADQRGWHGLGIDFSYRACTIARAARGRPVIQAESAAIPIRDACVDAVTLVNVLDHVPDPLGALREARRVLSPGARLVIRVPNAAFHGPWVRLLTALGPLVRWHGWDGYPVLHLYAFTPGGLRRLVERAGLRALEIRNSALAAEGPWVSPEGPSGILTKWLRGLIAAAAASVAVLSRGRWLAGASIELYATRPAGEDEVKPRTS